MDISELIDDTNATNDDEIAGSSIIYDTTSAAITSVCRNDINGGGANRVPLHLQPQQPPYLLSNDGFVICKNNTTNTILNNNHEMNSVAGTSILTSTTIGGNSSSAIPAASLLYQQQQQPGHVINLHAVDSTPPIIDESIQPIRDIAERLLSLRGCNSNAQQQSKVKPTKTIPNVLSESDIKLLCSKVKPILLSQSMLLELEAPMQVCGDIHGQYTDLLRLLEYGGFPPATRYLFLGDYVDRGKQSVETICLLLAYKILYPNAVSILRGNHESAGINRIYGFYDECKRRYTIKLWKVFSDVFNCLPAAALIEDKILCMHGGLSPELQHVQQIANLPRPCTVPDMGLLCDLLWSDPDPNVTGWGDNDRGVSYVFGIDIVKSFVSMHDLDLIVRAHQVVEDGYEFFADRSLVTLFSAPNYCGEFDNAGAMIRIDEDLMCSFQILKPSISAVTTSSTKNVVAAASSRKKKQQQKR